MIDNQEVRRGFLNRNGKKQEMMENGKYIKMRIEKKKREQSFCQCAEGKGYMEKGIGIKGRIKTYYAQVHVPCLRYVPNC